MKTLVTALLVSGLISAPVQAAEWNDVRPGAFVGARLTIGGNQGTRSRVALTLAPTQTRTGRDGFTGLKIGEGIALNLTSGATPTLTLAGIRADTALGLHRNGNVDSDKKLGVSTGGWIAIGVGVAVVAGGLVFLNALKEADENSD